LLPDEVTRLLGATPTKAQVKGQVLRGASGRDRVAKFGGWWLQASEAVPADLDVQIHGLLAGLSSDLSAWKQLTSLYKVDLFCGWFMEAANEGVGISPSTLLSLGERGIELSLDIYAGGGDA